MLTTIKTYLVDPESKALIRCLIAAFFACSTMLIVSHMRVVAAEDDCADPTLIVQRVPLLDQLVCIGEGARDGTELR